MHHGQNWEQQKMQIKPKNRKYWTKLGEKFINFAEIEGKFIIFLEIEGNMQHASLA